MFIEDGPRQTKIQIAGILKQFFKCETKKKNKNKTIKCETTQKMCKTLLSGPLWCSKINSG